MGVTFSEAGQVRTLQGGDATRRVKNDGLLGNVTVAINFNASDFYDSLIEIVGYKCGVALAHRDLKELLRKIGADDHANYRKNDGVRIHSASYEEIVYALLQAFGRLEPNFSPFPTIAMFHEYKKDEKLYPIYRGVMDMWAEWMDVELSRPIDPNQKALDPTPLLENVIDKYGRAGFEIVNEAIAGLNAAMTASPWGNLRQVEWRNEIELRALFQSEGLNAEYGNFFDQKYIDYLHASFPDIDRMNWRKFEHLTAEYLERGGYNVELGPGRGDDGIDVRAWSEDDNSSKPHVIVQCKRQKASVGKPIIKSLYADVLHEGAKSGLLVTTSRLSPGAESTRSARAYPIKVADRATLRQWLQQLRAPGVGGFLPD
jgi:restriction system protein